MAVFHSTKCQRWDFTWKVSACKEILLQNGAREVEMFALGKAI